MPPICFPVIQNRQEFCPREELTFSDTPPTCVRVVPVYQDITYTLGQFPPPVHFYISDTGEVYQLAPIQSPPSVPPEYHAVLDSTGCILVGVEFSNMRRGKILPEQVDVLPGVLRYVLTTLGLPLTSVTNALPPDRCNPNLWQQILTDTQNCLVATPPPPPNPCDFVLQCVGSSTVNVQDTTTVDLTLTGTTLSATVILNPSPNNAIVVTPTGLFAPQAPIQSVQDTNTVDFFLNSGVLSAQVIVAPFPNNKLVATSLGLFVDGVCNYNVPHHGPIDGQQGPLLFLNGSCLRTAEVDALNVPYGSPNGSGTLTQGNLYFNPQLVHLFATNIPYYNSVGSPALVALADSAILNPLVGRAYVASIEDYNGNGLTDAQSSLIAAINHNPFGLSLLYNSVFTGINTVMSNGGIHVSSVYNANSAASGQSLVITSSVHLYVSQENFVLSDNSFLSNNNVNTTNSTVIYSSFLARRGVNGQSNISYGSFVSLNDSTIDFNVDYRSFLSLAFVEIYDLNVRHSVFATANNPSIFSSTVEHSVVLLLDNSRLPDAAISSVVVADFPPGLISAFAANTAIVALTESSSFNAGFARSETGSVTVGNNCLINSIAKVGSVFVGYQITESQSAVLEVGRNFFMPFNEYAIGGYQIAIYDGRPLLQSFNNEVFYFFNNGNSTSYANNAAASAALNATYGTDPRIKYGSFVFVNVAGTPAIFAWNGTTFVRITV